MMDIQPLTYGSHRQVKSALFLSSEMFCPLFGHHCIELHRNHVAIKLVTEDFSSYFYRSRVKNPAVLIHTIKSETVLMTWVKDAFAYAEGYDDVEHHYHGIRASQLLGVPVVAQGLLAKLEAAQEQIERERVKPKDQPDSAGATGGGNS